MLLKWQSCGLAIGWLKFETHQADERSFFSKNFFWLNFITFTPDLHYMLIIQARAIRSALSSLWTSFHLNARKINWSGQNFHRRKMIPSKNISNLIGWEMK